MRNSKIVGQTVKKEYINLEPIKLWKKMVPRACENFGSASRLYYLIIAGSLFIRYHNSSGLLFEHSRSCPKTGFCSFSNNSIRPIYQPGPQNWCHKDALTPLSHFSFSVQKFSRNFVFRFLSKFSQKYHESKFLTWTNLNIHEKSR